MKKTKAKIITHGERYPNDMGIMIDSRIAKDIQGLCKQAGLNRKTFIERVLSGILETCDNKNDLLNWYADFVIGKKANQIGFADEPY